MTLQNRINELFTKFNLSLSTVEKTELMAEATLENGTVIFTDAEGFNDGADVYIVNEEGEKIPLPDGDYTLEDGRTLTIADSGKISKSDAKRDGKEGKPASDVSKPSNSKKGAPEAEAAPAPKKKSKKSAQAKLAEEDEEEKEVEKEIEDEEKLMDDTHIIDLINKVLDERFPTEIVEEEMSAEDKAVTELKALLQSQEEELTTLKSQAASEGVKRVTTTKAMPEVDLTTLSTEDRVKALFNKFNN